MCDSSTASEELDPLPVVHDDDLRFAVCLQSLQRAQQHPVLQAVELWGDAAQSVSTQLMQDMLV